MKRLFALALPSLFALAAGASSPAQQTCYDPDIGALIGSGDNVVFPIEAIGFTFPFAGATWSDMHISSNGFLYLSNGGVPAPGGDGCCTADPAALRTGSPRLAPLWSDVNLAPSNGGGCYLRRDVASGYTVVTWLNAQLRPFGGASPFGGALSFQCQMHSDGTISFAFDRDAGTSTSNAVIGLSPGGGAADPGASSLLLLNNSFSTTVPTVYYVHTFGGVASLRSIAFRPNAAGGFDVSNSACQGSNVVRYGSGCPRGCALAEEFDATHPIDLANRSLRFTPTGGGSYFVTDCGSCWDPNLGNSLGFGDDDILTGVQLGFDFPFCGGTSPAIGISSNGHVLIDGSAVFSTNVRVHASGLFESYFLPVIAPLFTDLDPSAAGTVHLDVRPGEAVVTWSGVPNYGATTPNDVQLQLFADGSFVLAYGGLDSVYTSWPAYATVGYAGTNQPWITDLSGLPIQTGSGGGGLPVTLNQLSAPRIGGAMQFEMLFLPTTTTHAALLFGLTPADTELAPLGAPGCKLLHGNQLPWVGQVAVPPTSTFSPLLIPASSSLYGVHLYAQGMAIAPTVNSLGIVVSDALDLTFGR